MSLRARKKAFIFELMNTASHASFVSYPAHVLRAGLLLRFAR